MKTMKECGNEFNPTTKDEYHVLIPDGDFLLVSAGVERGTSAINFTHPNILRTNREILAFKHYRKDGGKRWTEKAGMKHVLAIPKDKIYMVDEAGYSYVPVEINGVKYRLNVSGGSTNGWTDYIHQGCSIGVSRSKRKLEKLAEASVVPENLELPEPRKMEEHDEAHYRELCAYEDARGKLGEGSKIILGYRITYKGSKGPFFVIQRPKRKRHFTCSIGTNSHYPEVLRVYYKHINWTETAKANGIPLV